MKLQAKSVRYGLVMGLLWAFSGSANAERPLRVAVAANFAPSMKWLVSEYRQHAGQPVDVIVGSTGKLYAQIRQGAPIDIFFAADVRRPALLEEAGLTAAGSRKTYALGKLALWQPGAKKIPDLTDIQSRTGRVAIANPRLAPYGQAAKDLLQSVNLWDELQSRLLVAENVMQVYQYAHSGQATWALVPVSTLRQAEVETKEYSLFQDAHAPIEQQAVVLKTSRQSAAEDFLTFCLSASARHHLQAAGYGLP